MARRNRRASSAADSRPLFGGALTYTERAGRRWAVRQIAGSAAAKAYRCPGCQQEIRPGVPHVVAWPVGEVGDAERSGAGPWGTGGDERRHWHSACWQR